MDLRELIYYELVAPLKLAIAAASPERAASGASNPETA